MDKLTPKQKAFADYYIELGNAEQAAIKAGYSKAYARGNAHKLVANSCISKYIDERMKAVEAKRIASGDEVLQYLTSVMRGQVKDQFDLDPSLQDRTKAAELLGKRHRLFTEKVEVDNSAEVEKVKKISNIESILEQMKPPENENA